MRNVLLLASFIFASGPAGAQNVATTEMVAQPLQYMKDGAINGCGLRIVGMSDPGRGAKDAVSVDASLNLYAPGVAVLKALGGTIKTADVDAFGKNPGRGLPPERKWRPKAFWFKAEGSPATRPRDGRVVAGAEPPESAMYVADDIDPAFAVLKAVIEGQQIQFAITEPSRNFERIYQASIRISEREINSLVSCLRELLEGIAKK